MLEEDIKIEECDRYKYPHGAVYIGHQDETVSCGYLELAPDRATNKITRPLPEHIKQIEGSSEIEMFDEKNRITIKRLNPGEEFIVPKDRLHVHRNRGTETAVNYWEFQGNARSLVDQIKSNGMLDESHNRQEATTTLNVTLKPEDCQAYQLPSGKIYIGKSDTSQSFGFYELRPGMALNKHSRPVTERLKQINGNGQVEIYQDSNQVNVVKLSPGEELVIPANQIHIHSNKESTTSLTYWQYDGDVMSIIEKIRTEGIKA